MVAFLSWYLVITLAGWLAFPLAYRFLPALPSRGYALARALGWLVWGYLFWLLASLGVIQNDLGGVILALVLLGILSVWAAWGGRYREIAAWLRERAHLVISVEVVFLFAFALWAFIRAANPEIDNTEKPMELAFLNAILRSPVFPPHDPWLSGYAISYYYFGYVLVAMLIRITGAATGVGFNLAIALLFGLTAAGAYGLIYDLLALRRRGEPGWFWKASLRLPLLGPLFILLVSNLEGFLEVLHARGLVGGQGGFWGWLGILDINQPPAAPVSWMPARTWAWWRASRVLGDFSFDGTAREVIDEFPFFSYLLADLHPHVLAMPFALLMIGLALNVYLERGKEKFTLFGWTVPFSPPAFLFAAVLLGGLAFLNTWDFPIYIALVCAAYVLAGAQVAGWTWSQLGEFVALAAAFGISGILLYLPFYLGFSSQAGGILPSMVFFTRGTQFWVMFAPLLLPILAFLIWRLIRQERIRGALVKGSLISIGTILALWVGMYLFGFAITLLPSVGSLFMAEVIRAAGQGIGDVIRASLVGHTSPEAGWLAGRLTAPGAWISLAVILALIAALLIAAGKRGQPESSPEAIAAEPSGHSIEGFWLLLALLGALLVLVPEFFYLRDQFGVRMNTIFKFYYQAWLVWGIAAAFAVGVFLEDLHGAWAWIYRAGLVALLVMGLAYPTWSIWMKTSGFQPEGGLTLDGNAFLTGIAPDAMAAVEWLREAPPGVIAEAPGVQYQSDTSRLATQSGDPTVIGWVGHESQWRGGDKLFVNRPQDLEKLYRTADWNEALGILQAYAIRYVAIGPNERSKFHVNEAKFQRNLVPAFKSGSVIIYEVPTLTQAGSPDPAENGDETAMNLRKISLEHLAYGLAFGLALGIRLLFLGASPLSDPEAGWALQAFSLARGDHPLIGPQPGYILLTGLLFFLAGSDNFLARLVPALAGSLLVFFPYLLRSRLGTRAALLAAFGLALDPGLVALSRQAGSPILAISFLSLALAAWLDRKPVLAGVLAGLALLGGPAFWQGLLGLGIALLVYTLINKAFPGAASDPDTSPPGTDPAARGRISQKAILVFAGTLVLAGTLFFQVPRGLSAAADSLAAYLQGWRSNAGQPVTSLLVGLAAYEPLTILFGVWAAVRGWIRRDPVLRLSSLWFAAALVVGLVYPGRKMGDLGWALVPLWILAASQLAHLLWAQDEDRKASWIYTAVVLMVIGFIWLNFTGFLVAWQSNPEAQQTRALALTGGVILLTLATLLVTWGWSSRIAAQGLLRGTAAALVIYLLFATTASAGLRLDPTVEFWASYPKPAQTTVLMETVGDLSGWRTGRRDALDIVAVGIPSPALRWTLRSLPNARFSDQLVAGSQPSIILTEQEQEPALAASYRGESVPWLVEPDWQAMSLIDRLSWVAYHRGPVKRMDLILWARTDLFPDVSGSQAGSLP